MTTITFPAFQKFACDGDSVTVETGEFTLTARVYRDEHADKPDEMHDGFWPSLNPKDAGYIGPKSPRTLQRHMAKAHAVMDAWKRDEWWFCGVAVTVTHTATDVLLSGQYEHALWGIECNYPGSDNSNLAEVASELAEEAIASAREKLAILNRNGGPAA